MKEEQKQRWISAAGERAYSYIAWYRRLFIVAYTLGMLEIVGVFLAAFLVGDSYESFVPWFFVILSGIGCLLLVACWQSVVAQLAAGKFLHLSRRDTWRLNIRNIVVFEDSVAKLGVTAQRPSPAASTNPEAVEAPQGPSTDHADAMCDFDAKVAPRLRRVNRLMLAAIIVLVVGLVTGGILAALRTPFAWAVPASGTIVYAVLWALGTVLRTRIIRRVVREFELSPRQGRGLRVVTARGLRTSLLAQLELDPGEGRDTDGQTSAH